MTFSLFVGHTYHLIDLVGQQFFPGTDDVHQSLLINKAMLLSAMAIKSAMHCRSAYEILAVRPLLASSLVQEQQKFLITLENGSVTTTESLSSEFYSNSELAPLAEALVVLEITQVVPITVEAVVAISQASEHLLLDLVAAGLPQTNSAEMRLQESVSGSIAEASELESPAGQDDNEFERSIGGSVRDGTEYLLQDVQDILFSLTGIASRLAERKKDNIKQQKSLYVRSLALQDKERLLGEKEGDLRLLHKDLLHARNLLTQEAEGNTRAITERNNPLTQLAERLEAREHGNARQAKFLQQDNTRTEELSTLLRAHLAKLHKREGQLQWKGQEPNGKFKQLNSTNSRLSTIIKSFSESVQLCAEQQVIDLQTVENGGSRRGEPV